ncbi:MAG TPA: SDR family oxidoreductase [Kofleriaceae bacterium]|jgi:NAD(P)-dependent dehydrogenase (short-subunit alcohol dehydrogenase family)
MTSTFENKVALVTGANSGIGEAAAVALQAAGARVFATARRKDALESARAKHPRLSWLLVDVTKPDQVDHAIATITKEAGRLDVVVNNAAIFVFASLDASSDADIRAQFEINVLGTDRVTRAALPALRASKGSIINISSAAGHKPVANASHYGATKAAIESLTKSWALELAPHGVRVNAIAPGPTETAGFAKLAPSAEMLPVVRDAFVKNVPLGRMASPAEVARWIVTLADPANTWMTGEILAIDGGMSLG